MAAPYYGYGYGLCNNSGVQNIRGVTHQFGTFNGLGVEGNVNSRAEQEQREMCYHRPYSGNNGSATWVLVGPNPYNKNVRNQTIQGDVVQRGTFSGRGIGDKIHAHFSVSGDIN